MACTESVDLCVTRGSNWALDVALSDAYAEIIANPEAYSMNLVFRDRQDDLSSTYLTLNATPVLDPDPLPNDPPILFSFAATTTDTSSLPYWDIVAYCELIGPGTDNTRLFNAAVSTND